MEITSAAFGQGGDIPSKYTCEGENISPPLSIGGIPDGTESLALIMYDPDVPAAVRADRMFDHWVLFNIDPQTAQIAEGFAPGTEGRNTKGQSAYTGPCPPTQYAPTKHRYFFKLFALATTLDLDEKATKKDVEELMEGHILAQAELIGLYEKQG